MDENNLDRPNILRKGKIFSDSEEKRHVETLILRSDIMVIEEKIVKLKKVNKELL